MARDVERLVCRLDRVDLVRGAARWPVKAIAVLYLLAAYGVVSDLYWDSDPYVCAEDVMTTKDGGVRWVCQACGKTAASRSGADASPGWDEACMLNAVLCRPTTDEEQAAYNGALWWVLNGDYVPQGPLIMCP